MTLSVTNNFTAGEAIVASEMNANFTDVENYVNNNLPALGTANTFTGTNAFNAAVTLSSTLTVAGATTFNSTTTVNGNTQQTGTFTVGVDGTGHDVKFFGDTPSRYMEWDQSADKLIVDGDFSIATGRAFIAGGDDVDLDAVSGALITGSADGSGQHLAIDGNEIQSKSDATTAATLNLNILGGQIKIHDGTSSAPAIGFHNDANTGIYRQTTDTLGFAGKLFLSTALPQTSTGSYATLRRFSDGSIKELTSSERFKKDITDVALSDAYKILDARPIHYRDINDDSSAPIEAGLSAESLHDSGWTYAVTYDEDTTTPKGIHYEMLVAPLIAIVKDLSTRLAAVEG
tara:strand:- start:713 stop:1747 length:1035 start_codon:yes stop_codon:yes gene_type:complete